MTKRSYNSGTRQVETEDEGYKIFVSRVHASFDKNTVQRLLEEALGAESIVEVALVYPKPEDSGEAAAAAAAAIETEDPDRLQEQHRGFAFVTLVSDVVQQKALDLGIVRGGAKPNSTKKHTMYLRPVVREDEEDLEGADKGICFLWSKLRCPYGDSCKFSHQGEGGCLAATKSCDETKGKVKKCFDFRKGKCKLGESCPFSHDFIVPGKELVVPRSEAEKDCINWKTKGKCRKGEKCPYRHDEKIRDVVLNKTKLQNANREAKNREPLSIRVFGLSYETTEDDVRGYFEDCGKIVEITFPKFEDSGRSKGYCGVLFQSPKAVAKAVEKDGSELHGRWLSVQGGKMYLKKWEADEDARKEGITRNGRDNDVTDQQSIKNTESDQVGEFGQKVKRRKKHGFASE